MLDTQVDRLFAFCQPELWIRWGFLALLNDKGQINDSGTETTRYTQIVGNNNAVFSSKMENYETNPFWAEDTKIVEP